MFQKLLYLTLIGTLNILFHFKIYLDLSIFHAQPDYNKWRTKVNEESEYQHSGLKTEFMKLILLGFQQLFIFLKYPIITQCLKLNKQNPKKQLHSVTKESLKFCFKW